LWWSYGAGSNRPCAAWGGDGGKAAQCREAASIPLSFNTLIYPGGQPFSSRRSCPVPYCGRALPARRKNPVFRRGFLQYRFNSRFYPGRCNVRRAWSNRRIEGRRR